MDSVSTQIAPRPDAAAHPRRIAEGREPVAGRRRRDERPVGAAARERKAPYTRNELLAPGYNAGPGTMRAFARGVKPGSSASAYLDRLHDNWKAATRALRAT